MSGVVRFLVWTALVVGVIVGIARATAIRWWRVPSNDPVLEASISPTIEGGDLLLLWRLTEPIYGDLVVCPEPGFPDRYVVGRIVGEPGDVVEIENMEPSVDGKRFKTERICDPPVFTVLHPDDESEVEQSCVWEVVANKVHQMGTTRGHSVSVNNRKFNVADGHVFLLSDNRLFPYDSRDFGTVERETCKETIVGRLVGRRGWGDTEARLDAIQ